MLVEGIADDLLMGTLVFVFGLAVVLMILIKRQHYVQRIHPESQDNVNFTRQLITQQPNSSESRIRSEEITCPICLGDAIYAVETNCSHIFCGNCILAYWHHGSWIGAMRCPVCRQQVSLLLMDFNAEEVSRNNCDSRRLIIEGIHTYNRRFSGEPRKDCTRIIQNRCWTKQQFITHVTVIFSQFFIIYKWKALVYFFLVYLMENYQGFQVIDYIRDLPTLLRHAFTEFFTWNGLLLVFRVRIIICFVAVLLYFVTPFDIIPEAAFGIFGFLDDFFILFMLAIYISIIYRQAVEERAHY